MQLVQQLSVMTQQVQDQVREEEQMEDSQLQHLLEGCITESDVIGISMFDVRPLGHNDSLTKSADADSLYGLSTNGFEVADILYTGDRVAYLFSSVTYRTRNTQRSRMCLTGNEATIPTRIRGIMPKQIILDRMPNLQLCVVDTVTPGAEFGVYLYFIGYPFIPNTTYFTHKMVAVVNMCFNLVRHKYHELDQFQDLMSDNTAVQDLVRDKMSQVPRFESQSVADGHKDKKAKVVNHKTTIRGGMGCNFLRAFFEVLAKISTERDGYTLDDNIWGRDFSGIPHTAYFSPRELKECAVSLFNNHVVVFQAPGIKDCYQLDMVSITRPKDNDTDPHLNYMQDMKKAVGYVGDLVNITNVQSSQHTVCFVDIGVNYSHREEDSTLIVDMEEGRVLLESMLSEDRPSRLPSPVVEDGEELGNHTGMFSPEDESRILDIESEHDEQAEVAELDILEILQDSDEASGLRTYVMYGTKDCGNVTSGKVVVALQRTGEVLGHAYNPRKKKVLAGAQLYQRATRDYVMKTVRDWVSDFNKLPLAVMNILSDPEYRVENLDDSRLVLDKVILYLTDTFHYFLTQLNQSDKLNFRFEGYFDLKVNSTGPYWPIKDPAGVFKVASHTDFRQYIVNRIGNIMPPLTMLSEAEREGQERGTQNDYSRLTAETRTTLVAMAESAVLMTNPSNFKARVLTRCMKKTCLLDLKVCEVPTDLRTTISTDQRAWSKARYGTDPKMLCMNAAGVPKTAHASNATNSHPLSRMLSSLLAKEVVLPTQYVQHFCKVRHVFHRAVSPSDISPDSSDEDQSDQEEDQGENEVLPYFAEFDTDDFHADGFTSEYVQSLLTDLAKVLISMYEKEWHYHLMVEKKRQRDQVPIIWPRERNTIGYLPTNTNQIITWRHANPDSNHVCPPDSGTVIRSEGGRCA